MRQVLPAELAAWLADQARPAPQLLDVREPVEFAHCRIDGSVSMPLASVPLRHHELDAARPVVVICHHGGRSMQAALFLQNQGFAEVANLSGGVAAWARDVDPAMPTY